ncbi:CAP domain-containing protein [Novosphingobium sp. BL-8A]|uniref:CAP domain-containing protein n=1 Tax=Novosphingobium sp. BL-8A TaxID=3127639 RepID=UPI003756FC6E
MLFGVLAAAAVVASSTRPAVNEAQFQDVVLAVHNRERAAVGSAPLRWSAELARDAGYWADRLAASGVFRHDSSNRAEGENLWMGTRGAYRIEEMVSGWASEKVPLRRMRSWQDDYHRVGHYTQMVWSGTTAVGCAVSKGGQFEYLVCRYDPPGNVWNESPYGRAAAADPQISRSRVVARKVSAVGTTHVAAKSGVKAR